MSRTRLVLATVLTGLLLPAVAVSTSTAASAATAATRSYLAGLRMTDPDHGSDMVVKALRIPDVACAADRFQGLALGAGSEPTAGSLEYFAGVVVTCRGGKPTYELRSSVGDVVKTDAQVAPGEEVQIVITLNCASYPTCSVFSSVTNLVRDDVSVDVTADTTLTSDSAEFAGFPVYKRAGARRAAVPTFSSAKFIGCLFGNQLITKRDEQLVRRLPGGASLRPGNFTRGIFDLEYHAAA